MAQGRDAAGWVLSAVFGSNVNSLRLALFGVMICGVVGCTLFPLGVFSLVRGAVGGCRLSLVAGSSGVVYHANGRGDYGQHAQQGAPVVALQIEKSLSLVFRFVRFYGCEVMRSGCRAAFLR